MKKNKQDSAAKPDLIPFLREVEYWLEFWPLGEETGRWLSKEKGAGLDFEEIVNFLVFPVSQQIDLLTTLRSLSPVPLVKIFRETGRINLIIMADVSRSMIFGSVEPKIWILAKLATLFGYTAYRLGDKFGFYGCDENLVESLVFPPRRSKIYGLEIGEKLLDFQPTKNSGKGLLSAINFLPKKRSVIVLASDFHLPADFTEELVSLISLRHQLIPMILRDEKEHSWPKKFLGLINFQEIESSVQKILLFSGKTAESYRLKSQKERQELESIFKKYDIVPIYISAVDHQKISQGLERRRG